LPKENPTYALKRLSHTSNVEIVVYPLFSQAHLILVYVDFSFDELKVVTMEMCFMRDV